MAVIIDTEGPGYSVTSGDDVVKVETLINGTVDAIKLELELLPAVGEVSYVNVVGHYLQVFLSVPWTPIYVGVPTGVGRPEGFLPPRPPLPPVMLAFDFAIPRRVEQSRRYTAPITRLLSACFVSVEPDLRMGAVQESVLSAAKRPY